MAYFFLFLRVLSWDHLSSFHNIINLSVSHYETSFIKYTSTIAAHSTGMTLLYVFSLLLELPDSMNNSRNRLSKLQSDQDL